MPAGRGNKCEACYWKALLKKRLVVSLEAFESRIHRETFERFGRWLELRLGTKKAALTLNKHLPFLKEIQDSFDNIPEYRELAERFSVAGLRKHLLVVNFFEEAYRKSVSSKEKSEMLEKERIERLLSIELAKEIREALDGYKSFLDKKLYSGKTSLRSIRLALIPAVRLLERASSKRLPRNEDLTSYLKDVPGQKAAISGFINYLNREKGLSLSLEKREKRGKPGARKELEKKVLRFLCKETLNKPQKEALKTLAVQYFHGVDALQAKAVARKGVLKRHESRGCSVFYMRRNYWLPDDLSKCF